MDLPVNEMPIKALSLCVRCGQCCIHVGRTFWRNGDFKNYPVLEKLSAETESVDNGLPCEMLQIKNGFASCKIQEQYGYDAKPQVCREYPDGELCWYYQEEGKETK